MDHPRGHWKEDPITVMYQTTLLLPIIIRILPVVVMLVFIRTEEEEEYRMHGLCTFHQS